MTSTGPYSSKEAFVAAISKALNGPDAELEPVLLTLFNKDRLAFTYEGRSKNWDEHVAHMRELRSHFPSIAIDSHHFLRDGNMFAERHTGIGTGRDGSATRAEIFMIGELDEGGKAVWVEETIRFADAADKQG